MIKKISYEIGVVLGVVSIVTLTWCGYLLGLYVFGPMLF